MSDIRIEIYHADTTYLEGWYTIADLKRVIETTERMIEASNEMAKESGQDKFQSMDETTSKPGDDWQSTPKG